MSAYTIKHVTRYTYAAEVIDGANQIMLYPLADDRLEVERHEVCVSHDSGVRPDTVIDTYTDAFGNTVGTFTVLPPHTVLVIESNAAVTPRPILFPMDEQPAEEQWRDLRSRQQDAAFIDFLVQEDFPSLPDLKTTLNQLVDYAEKPLKNALVLSEYVFDHFDYRQGVTNVETPAEEIWRLKAGVCQDFAHMLLAMLRLVGVPARYVSGYVCPKDEGVRGTGATHAWVEAYIPFYGWLGVDPTNNCIVNDGHVRLAIGRNFQDCTPVKGTYKGIGTHRLTVSVNIESNQADHAEQPTLAPAPAYEVPDPEQPVNSYQRYMELLLRQQQEQQQQ
ncbi:MAG TPA: transglutaminase family protein [Hymenobacter sp.]|jgi:transglutaminase-like putative cysteine protease|uniref:transglutaminase family protein n=1 Tax=Hymenobacter sp. TaxID=1898978 RepID=UPI002ED849E0